MRDTMSLFSKCGGSLRAEEAGGEKDQILGKVDPLNVVAVLP
jgi:hypothetical protein